MSVNYAILTPSVARLLRVEDRHCIRKRVMRGCGLKTGVAISFVYALTATLFFVGVVAVVGTKWLASEPAAAEAPMSRVMTGAFIGLFLGAMLFGLIYSTLISFFVAKRRT